MVRVVPARAPSRPKIALFGNKKGRSYDFSSQSFLKSADRLWPAVASTGSAGNGNAGENKFENTGFADASSAH